MFFTLLAWYKGISLSVQEYIPVHFFVQCSFIGVVIFDILSDEDYYIK